MAYTLEETATAVSNIVENPDVIIFHSLSNDVKTKTNEECVQEFTEIIENVEQRFKDTKVIISLSMPRADDDAVNNKAQILGLLVKEKFRENQKITMYDNSNLSYKGKPINRFFNSEDKVHLTVNGTSMFAANIHDSIDSVLGLPRRLLHDARSSRPQNSRYQDDANSYDMFSYGNRVNYFRGRGNFNRNSGFRGRGQQYRGRGFYKAQ